MRTTDIKNLINRLLCPLNLKLETLTAEHRELERLRSLAAEGHFGRPVTPVPEAFKRCDARQILQAVQSYAGEFASVSSGKGCTQYHIRNDWYTSPDAEVLYAITRMLKPKRIVEVGAGNSTLLFREAISAERCQTRLISIDPHPPREISRFADEALKIRLESPQARALVSALSPGDFLFIDSSHEVKSGNDVVRLFLELLPALPRGVVVHVHDIFLPYEYPETWVIGEQRNWAEQYLVQAMLHGTDNYKVLWAGHYLQRTMADFSSYFPDLDNRLAQSLWMEKV
jgi:predicted O-methyltransferase YrrM